MEKGETTVKLDEWLFDMDRPGDYWRTIVSAAITIPCVVGPYTNVNCTLSLTRSVIRIKDGSTTSTFGDPLTNTNDSQFIQNRIPATLIATSHGQNDAGVFELNFNDERYLPCEGHGAVSEWNIKLSRASNQFDLTTVSDVILHLRYTAYPGNQELVDAASANLKDTLPKNGWRFINLKQDFPKEWYRFLQVPNDAVREMSFTLKKEQLPFYARNKTQWNLLEAHFIVESPIKDGFEAVIQPPGTISIPEPREMDAVEKESVKKSENPHPPPPYYFETKFPNTVEDEEGEVTISETSSILGSWKIQLNRKGEDTSSTMLKPEDVQNAYLVIKFDTEAHPYLAVGICHS